MNYTEQRYAIKKKLSIINKIYYAQVLVSIPFSILAILSHGAYRIRRYNAKITNQKKTITAFMKKIINKKFLLLEKIILDRKNLHELILFLNNIPMAVTIKAPKMNLFSSRENCFG